MGKILRCYIVDDELHAINVLKNFIIDHPGLELAGSSQNPLEALNSITDSEVNVDLLFLDINMPKITGLEFAKLVRQFTHVIFTTAYTDYGHLAFEADAYDYLLKPISYEKFLHSVNKVKNLIPAGQQHEESLRSYFYIKCDNKGKLVKINVHDITYIEAALNYIIIHLELPAKQNITYLTMTEISKYLPDKFIRIHKSFIVNAEKISSISGNTVHLENNIELSVGPSYRDMLSEFLSDKVARTKRS